MFTLPALVPIISLLALSAALMVVERLGAPVVLNLDFKGDIKRESRWFAQYGQAACTLVVALIIWRLDMRKGIDGRWPAAVLLAAVFGTSIISMLIKRLLGRVRPGRELAGQFLGPTWHHANYRESFPSSHSACAIAMSLVLARLYPGAAAIFWTLGIITAILRYVMDAHWPSDVLGGVALGYLVAGLTWEFAV